MEVLSLSKCNCPLVSRESDIIKDPSVDLLDDNTCLDVPNKDTCSFPPPGYKISMDIELGKITKGVLTVCRCRPGGVHWVKKQVT